VIVLYGLLSYSSYIIFPLNDLLVNKKSGVAVGLGNAQFMSIRQVALRWDYDATRMARGYSPRCNSTAGCCCCS